MKFKSLAVLTAGMSLVGCGSVTPVAQSTNSHVMLAVVAPQNMGANVASDQTWDFGGVRRGQSGTISAEEFQRAEAKALAGDKDAMVQVAEMFRRGSNGVARDEQKRVQWLRRASELNHAAASYELYLHYLNRGLDREAVRYETRAVSQGYVLPPRLDPRRG